ncbi:hypothetical protein MauCBS54593_008090, partial [Microsporum audouinii]
GHQSNRLCLLSRTVPPGPRSESFWSKWPALLKMVPWGRGPWTAGPSKMVPLRSWSKGSHSNRLRLLSRLGPLPRPYDASKASRPASLKMAPPV